MQPWLVALTTVFAPFIAFFIALVFFFRVPKAAQTGVILGGLLSLAGSVIMLAEGPAEPLRYLWFQSGDVHLQFGFLRDSLSLWFGAVVALITLCIEVYSLGYMAHDPAKSRFFAMLGLFGWAMLSFVYAVDLLQSFIFWELVGLASFFLIGFWYEKPSANAAAKKAFIMTRVGDVGLFIGVLLIVKHLGTYDILAILVPETGLAATVPEGRLTLIAVLLFTGIMGKSAQFPLHTWLPDAMEGPTPVSALLHSATMVAAGVFLFARLHPLFMASEACVFLVLVIATFTALLSSTIAMVESDIKKVLAYSSISQLGFMLMGLAAGSLFAGVFHLITHAFFKALLFLCAGSYIHHCDSNDMSVIGRRGGRKMRVTTLGLVIG
ncbi:NADH-quinone oxidoreductase subunit L, partial [Candidatus Poribacteria bacterium]|nr:NADH-quinone oxidoreductase subunit L [Candidatus Poribacteria bacterium]